MYNVASEGQASNMMVTVKRRFQKILMRRLRELTGSEAKAEQEFREILVFLAEKRAGS